MVASTKLQAKTWEEVGTRFAELEADLQHRLDLLGADTVRERRSVEQALQSLVNSLEQSFDGIGAAVQDVELRQDISEVVNSVRDAIAETFGGPSRHTSGAKPAARKGPGQTTAARKSTKVVL